MPGPVMLQKWPQYAPCECQGPCKADCPCAGDANFCEKFCGCDPAKCGNRFPGCTCKCGNTVSGTVCVCVCVCACVHVPDRRVLDCVHKVHAKGNGGKEACRSLNGAPSHTLFALPQLPIALRRSLAVAAHPSSAPAWRRGASAIQTCARQAFVVTADKRNLFALLPLPLQSGKA